MAGRTTLIIAHRLSTIKRADSILVLDGGRLVEHGSDADLVHGDGVYARLHALQLGRGGRGRRLEA
jgi:ABC-type multidrug transport system fused ATPase/permease subunit